jgi:hypothetical protein
MIRFAVPFLLFNAIAVCSSSAQSNSASYFCVVEFAGGLAYNETLRRWDAARFRPEGKFVLRMQLLKSRTIKTFSEKEEVVHDYMVTITKSGANSAIPCTSDSPQSRPAVTVDSYGWLTCSSSLTDYKFNLKTNRFISAYLIGYADGRDTNSDTPSISGGTCTKIN